jgi:hypothetical protein
MQYPRDSLARRDVHLVERELHPVGWIGRVRAELEEGRQAANPEALASLVGGIVDCKIVILIQLGQVGCRGPGVSDGVRLVHA